MFHHDPYYDALIRCGNRYSQMTLVYEPDSELRGFINEFIQGCVDGLPLMKLNRWLGYIQGCVIERGYTTVAEERDWTRPLFRPLDFG